jgi:hypothetical protein
MDPLSVSSFTGNGIPIPERTQHFKNCVPIPPTPKMAQFLDWRLEKHVEPKRVIKESNLQERGKNSDSEKIQKKSYCYLPFISFKDEYGR